ncbi:MAG: hypothetical protein RL720_294 [Actinomycetota bacterium]|jgi:uncharacterized repeat protein (TIGR02543 family)
MPPIFARLLSICTVIGVAVFGGISAAHAVPGDSIALYLSAPLVQGSDVTGAGSSTETFDSMTGAAWPGNQCPSSTNVGTISASTLTGGSPAPSGACRILTAQGYGGATSTTGSPSFGGNGSVFAATLYRAPDDAGTITFSFPNPVKYVGFWWSAGNTGNAVEFLSGNTVVATYNSSDMMTLLGSYPSPYPGSGVLTSLGGDAYPKGRYYGNPRGFTSVTPNTPSSIDSNSVFAYFNIFLNGATSVDAVRFSGQGFEFDNLTTSTVTQTPSNSLVFANSVLGKSVQFFPNLAGTSGTMPAQTDSSTATLNQVAFTKPGYAFTGWNTQANNGGTPYADQASYNFASDMALYAQWAPATYVVTYDTQGGSSVPNGTYSTGGSLTLPAAPTQSGFSFNGWYLAQTGGSPLSGTYSPPSYGALTLYAQWTALPAQVVSWSPTNTTLTSSPSAPNSQASTTGDGTIAYSVVPGGSSDCSVNSVTGAITFSRSGTCTVRALAAATNNYSSHYVDKVFTLQTAVPSVSASLAITGAHFFAPFAAAVIALLVGSLLFTRSKIYPKS